MNISRCFQFILLVSVTCGVFAHRASAAESIENLYEATVPIADRGLAARRDAISEGLAQVLVRYTGYSGVGRLAGVAGALTDAESYVIEYSVESIQVPAADGLSTERAEAIWVRYNASQIDDLVSRLQLPIWSSLRPESTYLVVQELWGTPELIPLESYPAMAETIKSVFGERGMPAQPLDAPVLDAAAIWQMNEVDAFQLFQASDAEMLFLIRVLDAEQPMALAEVVVVQESGLSVYRENTGNALQDVVSAVNKFVDSYSVEYAFLSGAGQTSDVYIGVLGMNGFAEYRRILDLLSGMDQVSGVRLEGFKGQQMLFRVSYAANPERLLAALARQANLVTYAGSGLSGRALASGTRLNPYFLATMNYQPTEEVGHIFVQPTVAQPYAPLDTGMPLDTNVPVDTDVPIDANTPVDTLDQDSELLQD